MSEPINLADPDCEPSDAQLVALSTRAFASVRPAQVEMLRKLRAEIEVARTRALRRLDEVTVDLRSNAEAVRAKP